MSASGGRQRRSTVSPLNGDAVARPAPHDLSEREEEDRPTGLEGEEPDRLAPRGLAEA